MSELLLPPAIIRDLDAEAAVGEPTCPHAQAGRFADTGRVYIRCQVAGHVLTVATNPLAAAAFCCGKYETCPVLAAERSGRLGEIQKHIAERQAARVTHRQIELGLRVDDRNA